MVEVDNLIEARPWRKRFRITSKYFYLKLLLVVIVLGVLPGLVLFILGKPGAVEPLITWLGTPVAPNARDDSWYPIAKALAYVDSHPVADGLYDETYYHSDKQFIYPPSSLIIFKVARFLGAQWDSPTLMNRISWTLIPAIAAVEFLLFRALAGSLGINVTDSRQKSFYEFWLPVAICTLSVLFFYPIMRGFTLGQIQTWLTFATIISIYLWFQGQKASAGVLVALVAAIKPTIIVVFVWGIIRREWRFVVGAAAVGAILVGASLLIFGWRVHHEYLQLLGYLSKRGESFMFNHSFEGLLLRLTHNGNNVKWDGTHTQVSYVPWIHWTATLFSLLILGWALFIPKARARIESLIDYCIVLVSSVIASPVAYEHHYGFLSAVFLCAALIWYCCAGRYRGIGILLAVSYTLCTNFIGAANQLADTNWNWLQSYVLWGALLLFVLLHRLKPIVRDWEVQQQERAGAAPRPSRSDGVAL